MCTCGHAYGDHGYVCGPQTGCFKCGCWGYEEEVMAKQEPGYVPQDGHSILIGQIGSAPEWYYFGDDPKDRENAQNWLGVNGSSLRRLFRVYLDDVVELAITPPVPSRLVEKQKPETA